MKTTQDRTDEIMRYILEEIYIPLDFRITVEAKIRNALKEQDKITRHACAEMVGYLFQGIDHDVIGENEVKNVIMNTKSV